MKYEQPNIEIIVFDNIFVETHPGLGYSEGEGGVGTLPTATDATELP